MGTAMSKFALQVFVTTFLLLILLHESTHKNQVHCSEKINSGIISMKDDENLGVISGLEENDFNPMVDIMVNENFWNVSERQGENEKEDDDTSKELIIKVEKKLNNLRDTVLKFKENIEESQIPFFVLLGLTTMCAIISSGMGFLLFYRIRDMISKEVVKTKELKNIEGNISKHAQTVGRSQSYRTQNS